MIDVNLLILTIALYVYWLNATVKGDCQGTSWLSSVTTSPSTVQRVWVQSLAGSKDPRRLSAKKAKLKTEVILLKIISIKTLKNGPH